MGIACEGDVDAAIEAALTRSPSDTQPKTQTATKEISILDEIDMISAAQPPIFADEWEALLPELFEMGFEDVEANKRAITANNGILKDTVTALVAEERAA